MRVKASNQFDQGLSVSVALALSVTVMLLFYGGICDGGTSSPSDPPVLPPTPDQILVELRATRDISPDKLYDAFAVGGIKRQLEISFSYASQTVRARQSAEKLLQGATVNITADFRETYYTLKVESPTSYPYFMISAFQLLVNNNPTFVLGYTPVGNHPGDTRDPGQDSRDSIMFSILHYHEIETIVSLNNNTDWWSAVAVHELGHQRASLTHPKGPDSNPLHHYSEFTSYGKFCVMHLTAQMDEQALPVMLRNRAFCGRSQDYTSQPRTNSCIRFLYESGEM